jgi:hypothetical protein
MSSNFRPHHRPSDYDRLTSILDLPNQVDPAGVVGFTCCQRIMTLLV